ncbi:Protein SAR DEFICIENT 1, partial [Ananas comosus]
ASAEANRGDGIVEHETNLQKPALSSDFHRQQVEDAENSPLQILLAVGRSDGDSLPTAVRTGRPRSSEAILKERNGKRPLLTGDVNVILRDGIVMITELQFTDNSSWDRSESRSRSYDGPRIKEAMTSASRSKITRRMKHHPPYLGDEVWRLEKIGKDGAFHKKLALQHVNTVQDFLKLFEVDRHHLREILGAGMSDRMWEVTVNHAKECVLGDKIYVHRGPQCTLFLNPICQVVKIVFDDMSYDSTKELPRTQKNYVQQLVQEAYRQWDALEEAEGLFPGNIPLIPNESVMHEDSGILLNWNPNDTQGGGATDNYRVEGFEEDETPAGNWQVAYSGSTGWGYMHNMTG